MHKTAAMARGEPIDEGARIDATAKISPQTEVAAPIATAISPVPFPNRRGKRRFSRSEGQDPASLESTHEHSLSPSDDSVKFETAARSRFIPHKLLMHFESVSWPVAPAETASRLPLGSVPRMDIGARMRSVWR